SNGKKIVLLGVHYKSKVGADLGNDLRLAEAQHTRAIADAITAADSSIGVIILGDYNDVPGSDPLIATESGGAYVDAASSVPNAYSFNFNGQLQLIDHQEGNAVAHRWLDPSSVVIRHGPGVDDEPTSPGGMASDHAPIFGIYQVR